MSFLEKVGFFIVVLSVIVILLKPFVEHEFLQKAAEEQHIIFIIGLGIWAFGRLMTQNKEAKEKKASQ